MFLTHWWFYYKSEICGNKRNPRELTMVRFLGWWIFYLVYLLVATFQGCRGLNCVPPKFICWSPDPHPGPPNETVFGNVIFKVVIKVKWDHWGGPWSIWLVSLYEEEIRTHICTVEWSCESTGRQQLSTSHGERPQEKPTLLTPWSQTSSSQDCEKINIWCLSP